MGLNSDGERGGACINVFRVKGIKGMKWVEADVRGKGEGGVYVS